MLRESMVKSKSFTLAQLSSFTCFILKVIWISMNPKLIELCEITNLANSGAKYHISYNLWPKEHFPLHRRGKLFLGTYQLPRWLLVGFLFEYFQTAHASCTSLCRSSASRFSFFRIPLMNLSLATCSIPSQVGKSSRNRSFASLIGIASSSLYVTDSVIFAPDLINVIEATGIFSPFLARKNPTHLSPP